MKKIFAIIALAGFMASCGDAKKEETTETPAAETPATETPAADANTMSNMADSASKMMGNAADTANKMLNNAADAAGKAAEKV